MPGAGLLAAWLIVGVWAFAPPPNPGEPIAIEWDQPARCEQDGFRRALRRHLGEDHDLRSDRVLGASVKVRQLADDTWVVDLVIRTESGIKERRLTADRCETVTDAAAFATAVAIDPSVLDRLAEASRPVGVPIPATIAKAPSTVPTLRVVEQSLPPPPPRRSTPDDTQRSVGAHVRVEGGFAIGVLPGPSGSPSLAAGLHGNRRPWRAEFHGAWESPSVAVQRLDPQAGGAFDLWAVGLRACGTPGVRRLEFLLCGGIEGGQVRGTGFGFRDARRVKLGWSAFDLSPGLAWLPLPRLALVARTEFLVPFQRHEFGIEDLGLVHRLGAIGFRAFGGVEARF